MLCCVLLLRAGMCVLVRSRLHAHIKGIMYVIFVMSPDVT